MSKGFMKTVINVNSKPMYAAAATTHGTVGMPKHYEKLLHPPQHHNLLVKAPTT